MEVKWDKNMPSNSTFGDVEMFSALATCSYRALESASETEELKF